MSIDIQSENTCSITDAAKLFPGKPHVASVWRWIHLGIHGQRLETIRVGGRRFTSHEAIARFIERTTAAADGLETPARIAKQRQNGIQRAEA